MPGSTEWSAFSSSWRNLVKEESARRKATEERRQERIVRAVRMNMEDPDFTFEVLEERFGETRSNLWYILRKYRIKWDGALGHFIFY